MHGSPGRGDPSGGLGHLVDVRGQLVELGVDRALHQPLHRAALDPLHDPAAALRLVREGDRHPGRAGAGVGQLDPRRPRLRRELQPGRHDLLRHPLDDLALRGARRGGAAALQPARDADERRPGAGRRRAGDDVGDVADPAVGGEDGEGLPDPPAREGDLAAAARRRHEAIFHLPPTETSNSTWLTSGRRREKLCTSGWPPLSCTVVRTTSNGEPATTSSSSASSGAAMPTSTTIRACARSAAYSRRRYSYSEPWVRSASAAFG